MGQDIIQTIQKTFRQNSPVILTSIGIVGTLTTAYLAGRASFTAAEVIMYEEQEQDRTQDPLSFKDRTKLVWKLYIPAIVSGAITVAAIISANRANTNRTAAAIAAYSVTEKAFDEYKQKVVEQLGERKEQNVRDEIAQDRVSKTPPSPTMIIETGNVMCCEMHTMRYFESSMEKLRTAQNNLNQQLINSLYCSMSDFYHLIGLQTTSESDNLGWDSDKLMELRFTSTLSPEGTPCLAFEYNYVKPL
jgi:hypothetical protein